MFTTKNISFYLFSLMLTIGIASCYSFSGAIVEGRTFKLNIIENRAQYNNPQLAPNLNDRIRQTILRQSRLQQTNNDSADYVIGGEIRTYQVSTSGVSNQQVAVNRLTVGLNISVINNLKDSTYNFDVSRSFDFDASLSLQAAEARLLDEMVRNLSDDVFNRLFSDW